MSKEHGSSCNSFKKPGPGRKSAKQHRDENDKKDIAMGTQTLIETFILGQHEIEITQER